MSMCYIYGLVDPRTNRVVYVGRSVKPDVRLQTHLRECNGTSRKSRWLHELSTDGLQPSLVILDHVPVATAKQVEMEWIRHYRDLGQAETNGHDQRARTGDARLGPRAARPVGPPLIIEGQALRDARIQHGLTQRELALMLGVSLSAVSRWENRARRIPDHVRLSLVSHFGWEI